MWRKRFVSLKSKSHSCFFFAKTLPGVRIGGQKNQTICWVRPKIGALGFNFWLKWAVELNVVPGLGCLNLWMVALITTQSHPCPYLTTNAKNPPKTVELGCCCLKVFGMRRKKRLLPLRAGSSIPPTNRKKALFGQKKLIRRSELSARSHKAFSFFQAQAKPFSHTREEMSHSKSRRDNN